MCAHWNTFAYLEYLRIFGLPSHLDYHLTWITIWSTHRYAAGAWIGVRPSRGTRIFCISFRNFANYINIMYENFSSELRAIVGPRDTTSDILDYPFNAGDRVISRRISAQIARYSPVLCLFAMDNYSNCNVILASRACRLYGAYVMSWYSLIWKSVAWDLRNKEYRSTAGVVFQYGDPKDQYR